MSLAAIEEALVNAIYHRSYEEREPIEVQITPEEITILSFPGPDRSVRMEDLRCGRAVARRYRNRRIGEFLKELELSEGRGTDIPKILEAMRANGSAEPLFETDENRSSFLKGVGSPCRHISVPLLLPGPTLGAMARKLRIQYPGAIIPCYEPRRPARGHFCR